MKNSTKLSAFILAGTILTAAPALAANIATQDAAETTAQRAQSKPPMANASADMKAVLDAQASLKPKPIETLTPAEARAQPSPADGAKLVMQYKGLNPADPMGVSTKDMMIPGAAGDLKARVYTPQGAKGTLPVILYFHGGGWVIADLDTYDASPRALSKMAQAIVVSVHYRQGPENKFPAAHDDAFAAYKWLIANAGNVGGNGKKVALAGESAGGNLAINTAIAARDAGIQMPTAQVLVYPVAGADMGTLSYKEHENAKPLNKAMIGWFIKNYLNDPMKDVMDPRIDINGHADVKGLPPTTIINAEIDPLRSDGQNLASKLKAAGVKVEARVYPGVTHEFFGMGAVVEQAKNAEMLAAKNLKKSFGAK